MVDTKKIEEELPIELLQKGFSITDTEVATHPTLELSVKYLYNFSSIKKKELEGSFLTNKTIKLNAKGVNPNSANNRGDGITIFGIPKPDLSFNPDVTLNLPEDKIANIKNPKCFLIYYRRDLQKYYIESIAENKEIFFIFVLLSTPFLLTTETVIVSILNFNFKIKTNAE